MKGIRADDFISLFVGALLEVGGCLDRFVWQRAAHLLWIALARNLAGFPWMPLAALDSFSPCAAGLPPPSRGSTRLALSPIPAAKILRSPTPSSAIRTPLPAAPFFAAIAGLRACPGAACASLPWPPRPPSLAPRHPCRSRAPAPGSRESFAAPVPPYSSRPSSRRRPIPAAVSLPYSS